MKINLIGECLNKLRYNHPVESYADIKSNNSAEKYFISLRNAHDMIS